MSSNEGALFIAETQRERILRAVFEAYYAEFTDNWVIFDTNRTWCSLLPALVRLFPQARVICCLRNPAWILDSLERLVQKSPLLTSRLFNNDTGNVYSRVDALVKNHLLGPSLSGLRQAWVSEDADRLIGLRYDSLVNRPAEVITALYGLLDETPYIHDYENVKYEEREFDARIGLPGLHSVRPRIEAVKRQTILPPELFNQHDKEFWEMPGQNPRRVTIL